MRFLKIYLLSAYEESITLTRLCEKLHVQHEGIPRPLQLAAGICHRKGSLCRIFFTVPLPHALIWRILFRKVAFICQAVILSIILPLTRPGSCHSVLPEVPEKEQLTR